MQVSLSGQFLEGAESSGVLRASAGAGKSMLDPVLAAIPLFIRHVVFISEEVE